MADGTGSKHYFTIADGILVGPLQQGCGGDWGPDTVVANDGSGYTAVVTGSQILNGSLTWVLYDKNGDVVSSPASAFTDPDGNSISNTDTLGQVPITVSLGRLSGNPDTYTYTDVNGGNQTYTVSYSSKHIKTIFGCSGNPYDIDKTGVYLPSSVTLPTGAQYVITYESTPGFSGDVTGRLGKVTLPSGGYVSFAYSGGHGGGLNGFDCNYQTIPQIQISVNDNNGHTSTTTYVHGYSSPITVTETDSLGDVTTHYFGGVTETERITSDVNLGQRSKTITCFEGNFTNCPTTGVPSGGMVFQADVYTYPGTSSSPSLVETKFDGYGNPTQISRWDFGAAFPPVGNPVSKTTYTYDTASGPCGALSNAYITDRPCSVTTVNNTGATVSQTNYTYNATGHAIQTSRWITGSSYATTTATYNGNGTLATTTDALSPANTTTYHYDGSCNSILPTSTTFPIVNGVTITTSQTWDCNGGVKTSSTDGNGNPTTYSYANPSNGVADPLWRLTKTTYPDTGSTTTTYNTGATLPWSISTSTAITSGNNLTSTALYDGLGRVTQTQLTSDPEGTDYVDTTYEILGRKATVSNPHRSGASPTDGSTTYTYDALDRVLTVLQPDGSQVSTVYNNNCTTVTDEAGKARQSCSDGLGRLTQLFEDPGSSPHLNYETDYGYDPLNNLLSVTQHGGGTSGTWRTRTFAYDGLSRLSNATNPESGYLAYTYDGNGNVLTKQSPAPNQLLSATETISYCYDALNRLTAKAYTLSPTTPPTCSNGTFPSSAATYSYDQTSYNGLTIANGIGRRTGMSDTSGATAWNYDPMGRTLTERRKINGSSAITQNIGYTYNLDGSMATVTYPSGRTITYAYSAAARRLSAVDSANSINYAASATYAPPGGLTQLSNGSSISGALTYNNRLQLLQMYYTAGTISSTTLTQLQQSACPTATATIMNTSYNFSWGTTDNGNVQSITNCRDTSRTQNFAYDSLNRIQQANSSGSIWGETYTIDPWGNLTNENPVSGKTSHEGLSTSANVHNQLAGFGYDAAGNMTSNGGASYNYDAENRLNATAGISYVYDGEGKRVVKCTQGTSPGTCSSSATGTLYWRGVGADTLAESNFAGTMQEEYIFFDGQRIARRDASGGAVHYYFSDRLGSHGVVMNAAGSSCEQDIDYYPYGGQQNDYCNTVAQHYKFTGKERDTESGLDNFEARYDASALGRFMTPDPGGVGARLTSPQTWNAYAYVENNPLNLTDPSGLVGTALASKMLIPALCDLGSDGGDCYLKDFNPGEGPPAEPQKKTTELAVEGENGQTHQLGTWAGREATYYVVEVDKNGKRTSGAAETSYVITLSEKSSNKSAQIADPPQTQPRQFDDTQSVQAGHPYDVTRRWSIGKTPSDTHPARVLDPVSGKLFNYEVLHLSFEAKPQLTIEYKNDQ